MKKTKLCHGWFNTFFVDGIQQQQAALSRDADTSVCNSEENNANCSGNGASANVNFTAAKNGVGTRRHKSGDMSSSELPLSHPSTCGGGIAKRDSTHSDKGCAVKVK